MSNKLQRPLRFGLVGLSGVVVNSAALWALARGAHLAVPLASAFATEAAVLSNFALNDRWTFRAAPRHHSVWQRLLRFNGVALGGMAITATLLTLLTLYGQVHLLLANLLAVGAAMGWNYVVNSRWTWGRQAADGSQQPAVDDWPSAAGDVSLADWQRPTADCLLEEAA